MYPVDHIGGDFRESQKSAKQIPPDENGEYHGAAHARVQERLPEGAPGELPHQKGDDEDPGYTDAGSLGWRKHTAVYSADDQQKNSDHRRDFL